MHILIKNKKLYFNDYRIKCALGKRGIGTKKKEGDLITPKGLYKIRFILYRKDRVKNLKTKKKKLIIKKNMGWCNDPNSKSYNKLIKLPLNLITKSFLEMIEFTTSFLFDYNMSPIKKNKGSNIYSYN